jgi:hypothetical protein
MNIGGNSAFREATHWETNTMGVGFGEHAETAGAGCCLFKHSVQAAKRSFSQN